MKEQSVRQGGLALVKKPVARVEAAASGAVREGSTGRVVVLPQVWAVGVEAVTPLDSPVEAEGEGEAVVAAKLKPELAFYRKYTEAMLRRYLRMSMANGRVPSLLGRELFRGNVTHYSVSGFDDVVIFCMDVERCLKRLTPGEMAMVRRIGIQEYSREEAGTLLGKTSRHIRRTYGLALDKLTEVFLEKGLMEPLKSCQGGKEVLVGVS